MTAHEVAVIIKACEDAQVSVLKFGGLYVRFGKKTKTQARGPLDRLNSPLVAPIDAAPSSRSLTAMSETPPQQNKDALERDELSMRADQIAHMLIEDPLQAEELLMKGELERDDGSDGSE